MGHPGTGVHPNGTQEAPTYQEACGRVHGFLYFCKNGNRGTGDGRGSNAFHFSHNKDTDGGAKALSRCKGISANQNASKVKLRHVQCPIAQRVGELGWFVSGPPRDARTIPWYHLSGSGVACFGTSFVKTNVGTTSPRPFSCCLHGDTVEVQS